MNEARRLKLHFFEVALYSTVNPRYNDTGDYRNNKGLVIRLGVILSTKSRVPGRQPLNLPPKTKKL
jgi:hypothetical protein